MLLSPHKPHKKYLGAALRFLEDHQHQTITHIHTANVTVAKEQLSTYLTMSKPLNKWCCLVFWLKHICIYVTWVHWLHAIFQDLWSVCTKAWNLYNASCLLSNSSTLFFLSLLFSFGRLLFVTNKSKIL